MLEPEDDDDVEESESDEESDSDELESKSEESPSDSELGSELEPADDSEDEGDGGRLVVRAGPTERVASGALERALPSFALDRFLAGLPAPSQTSVWT